MKTILSAILPGLILLIGNAGYIPSYSPEITIQDTMQNRKSRHYQDTPPVKPRDTTVTDTFPPDDTIDNDNQPFNDSFR